jgi:hypothetical protein
MEIKWYRWVLLLVALALAAFFVVGRLTDRSIPEQTHAVPDVLREVENPRGTGTKTGSYAETLELRVGESALFADGLSIGLLRIEDSRCPKDAVCVWAGELAAVLSATGGGFGAGQVQIRLGELTGAERTSGSYIFSLKKNSTDGVSFIVTMK